MASAGNPVPDPVCKSGSPAGKDDIRVKTGMELMVQTILISLFCLLLAQMIGSNLSVFQARDYFYRVVDQIECSDNPEETAQACQKDADQRGYVLQAEMKENAPGTWLTMYYEIRCPFLSDMDGTLPKGVIQAYAR